MTLPIAQPLKLFVLAGEPSGDRIAADVVRRLRERVPVNLSGVGGHELAGQGLVSLFPMSDLAVMGVTDVLKRLPLLLWRIEQTARAIRASQPDIVVLFDAQDFSALLARRLRRKGYKRPILLYVAPSVWARSPQRAPKLVPLFNEVLAVLPFEPEVMVRLGGPPTAYVGHPALGERLALRNAADAGPIVLLPGSRDGELRRHLPLFRQVAAEVANHPAVTGFVIPTLPTLAERLRQEVADWPVAVTVVSERSERAALYGQAVLALAVSGTATLELALAGVPMVISYVMDGHQARVYEKINRPMIGLPNIVLKRLAAPELVLSQPDAAPLLGAVRDLLNDKAARQGQIAAFGELSELMEHGEADAPRQDPAERILAWWQRG